MNEDAQTALLISVVMGAIGLFLGFLGSMAFGAQNAWAVCFWTFLGGTSLFIFAFVLTAWAAHR